ncbi:50S ribosomal protein L11 methyltransferase [soil metagenome]|nr:50S ribosomal protein L11 methyltransferase [Euzebyaceae bacterium]
MVWWCLRTHLDTEAVVARLGALDPPGLLGISEEGGAAALWFANRPGDLPLTGRWEEVPDRDWNVVWREGLSPVTVGAVTVTPPWIAPAADGIVLVIEPGQAFGTGHHETTAGCLAALQERALDRAAVCDVGTGTGLLAIAAARLGAARAVALDTDPLAVAAARANAVVNGVKIDVRHGSVEAVAGDRFDVVLANLDTATVAFLAPALVALVGPGGALIVAGVSLERRHEAEAAFERAGLPVRARPGREWAVLLGGPPGHARGGGGRGGPERPETPSGGSGSRGAPGRLHPARGT